MSKKIGRSKLRNPAQSQKVKSVRLTFDNLRLALGVLYVCMPCRVHANAMSMGFGVTATSTATVAPGLKTITYSIANDESVFKPGGSFEWINASTPARIYLQNNLPATGKTVTASTQCELTAVVGGTLKLPLDRAFAANADDCREQRASLAPGVGHSVSFTSTYLDGSTSLQLISTLDGLGGGSYLYSYAIDELTSSSTSSLSFTWASAGLSGSISTGSPFTTSFIADKPGLEIVDDASFTSSGGEIVFLATAVQPIPEPSSPTLVGLGVMLCALTKYRP